MVGNGDMYSLEDEDCSQLFITQVPKENIADLCDKCFENMDVDGLFSANERIMQPCVSMFAKPKCNVDAIYSDDISDAEDFENVPVRQPIFRLVIH